MSAEDKERLERAYAEAITVGGGAIFQKANIIISRLIDDVAARIDHHKQGGGTGIPPGAMAEMASIARTIGHLKAAGTDELAPDPNEGMRGLCEMLERARQDYEAREHRQKNTGEATAPEENQEAGRAKEGGELFNGDQKRPNQTAEDGANPQTSTRRLSNRGRVISRP